MMNTLQNISKRDPQKLTLRRSIKAPAGHKLISVDSSQIEARMLAFIAGEAELVEQFREGRDPYSELAEKIFSVPWQEIKAGAKSGNKKMKAYRNVGKTAILSCLAGDTVVLTDTGWKVISSVTTNDKLWDGESWVQHEGLICNGKRNTIALDGLRVTPDHLLFDGTSWRTAEEFLSEPSYLKSALFFGDAVLSTLQSQNGKEPCAPYTCASVPSVESATGCWSTRSLVLQKVTVSIAHRVAQQILGLSRLGTPITNRARASRVRHSLSYVMRDVRKKKDIARSNAWFLCNVIAGRSPIGSCSQIFGPERRRGVMHARSVRPVRHRIKITGATQRYALTRSIDGGFLRGLRRVIIAVITLKTATTSITAGVESSAISPADTHSYSTSCPCRDGITPTSTSTESITMDTMSPATCDSRHVQRMSTTDGPSKPCRTESRSLKQRTQNCELVYDIRNAGPNHRFLVRTDTGVLLVHNCGYGVGSTKFSNTLLRQGVHLSDDLEQHHEMAKHAHNIYRMSNSAITSFWKECQRVIEHLCLGGEGYFGTPVAGKYPFHYAMLPVPGAQQVIPSIELLGTGYTLRYPGLRWERNEHGKVEYFYDRPRGKNMVKTRISGGALTENLIQALAFQLLMWQACRIYEEGIPMLANIHDAWLSYAPEAEAQRVQQRMEYWMSQVPDWLKGFPVACEGEIGDTYEIA